MSEFYELPVEKQIPIVQKLASVALACYEISSNADITLIAHRENTVFQIDDTKSGKRYVLRVHRAGYHTDNGVRSELTWMKALLSEFL